VTLATPLLGKFLRGHIRTVPGNMRVKFEVVALTVLELLAFNTQKCRGSRDPGHAPFWKVFTVSCMDCPWKHARQI